MLPAESLFLGGVLRPLDHRIQDTWFQWQGLRTEPKHVVIVAIDEATLTAYPNDPMVFLTNRLADAIERLRLAGALVVGLDVLLSISPESWMGTLGGELQQAARDYDRTFREQINSRHLVLVATHVDNGIKEADYLLPSPDYLLALPDFDIPGYIGLADFLDEGDGVIREYLIAPVAGSGLPLPESAMPKLSFPALLALRATKQDPGSFTWLLAGQQIDLVQPPMPIPYLGPPGSFPHISLKDLLAGPQLSEPLANLVRGKVVIIGGTIAGMSDMHFTPYTTSLLSGRHPLMTGVELHANVTESLLTGERLYEQGDASRRLVLLVLSGLAVSSFIVLSAWQGVVVWLSSLPILVLAGLAMFQLNVLISVAAYGLVAGIALLTVLGWRVTGEERERTKIRSMFGRYVSEQVVEALLESGERPELGGQMQEITVLFSDIRNFTTISERLSARELIELLNTYFERACEPILAQNGSIDKFIGDAIMIEFGSPLPIKDHALRAITAAVALTKVADEFAVWIRQRFPDRDLPDFAIGIGLHSGEAVVGNVGSPNRMEFTAIGDTVNLASRLEDMTKTLGCTILASQATIERAGTAVICGYCETIAVQGRKAAIQVYEVLGVNHG
jgi:adenylate cyclase